MGVRQREDWWEYTKRIIRSYPTLERKRKAGKELTAHEQRRLDGVSWALEEIQRMPGGRARREIIQRVYFDNSHTLYGAALLVPIGEATAKRWNAEFIRLLAKKFDFP